MPQVFDKVKGWLVGLVELGLLLVALGIVLLVLGVGGGAALFLLAGSTREETIARFARAPAGCTTTLEFDKVGTYDVYIELTGTVGAVGGDCAGNGQSYQWAGTTLPAYALTMVDGDGQSVVLAPSTAHSYDTGTWRGQTVNQVQITTDRKSTRLNSSHVKRSRMPSSA